MIITGFIFLGASSCIFTLSVSWPKTENSLHDGRLNMQGQMTRKRNCMHAFRGILSPEACQDLQTAVLPSKTKSWTMNDSSVPQSSYVFHHKPIWRDDWLQLDVVYLFRVMIIRPRPRPRPRRRYLGKERKNDHFHPMDI